MIDIELYGGKRGILAHVRARMLYSLGAYGHLRDIEWLTVRRLVFVCRGNICRSPYASFKARSLGVSAISFGLDAVEGASADPSALRNARIRGVDMSTHRSVRMESDRLADRDLISVFEPGQLTEVRCRFGVRVPIMLMGIWSRPIRPHIQDPYGRGDRYFQQCYSIIDENIENLVDRMRRSGSPALRGEPLDNRNPNDPHRTSFDREFG